LLWDENFKWAVLPLEVVAKNFERQKVLSWLRSYRMQTEFPSWVQDIQARGIRQGLSAYAGGTLEKVHGFLKELNLLFGGRQTCQEISTNFLKHLRTCLEVSSGAALSEIETKPGSKPSPLSSSTAHDLVMFFEQAWKILIADFARVEGGEKKAPALYWFERLQSRLGESSPPVEKLKPKSGIRLYRLQQAPIIPASQLWIFGMPSYWFSGDGSGSLWFSERDREILAGEFAMRSSVQVRAERIEVLKDWISAASEVIFLDSSYSADGREVESLDPVLKELEAGLMESLAKASGESRMNTQGKIFPQTPEEKGSHPRFSKSYQVIRPIQPQQVKLPPESLGPGKSVPQITATVLDRYSRCSFQALAYHRWKLRDSREPDSELWPEVRGNILHEALRLLMSSLDSEGVFALLPKQALERAWKNVYPTGPKGLIRSSRIENYVKSRMVTLLEIFLEKEKEYLKRSGVTPASLDETQMTLDLDGVSIRGKPDRVDRHPDGWFVIDYKTSGTVAHGSEILENGYRLQLPFYALAVRKETQQSVLGVQFVELDRRGSRKSGIFFNTHNGKEEGHLTSLRANSKSLMTLPQEEVWDRLEEQILQKARGFVNGEFEAKPNVSRRTQECSQCRVADLCGFRRWNEPECLI
jgi:RecB family exonuclease